MSDADDTERNEVHYPDEETTLSDNDDAMSSKSSVSVSHTKMDCPHCPKAFQVQSMFRHIRNTHPNDFECYMTVWDPEKLQKMMNVCEPFPVEYTSTNDHDETVEHKLYGCLACNNTFTTLQRGTTHVKNKKCKARHMSELKGIIKQERINKKNKKKLPPTRPKADLIKDIVLEQRRYKYILKCSVELNATLDKLLEKSLDAEYERNKRITNLPTYPQECYSIPPDMNSEQLTYLLRTWGGRTNIIEDRFRKLRDWLYFFSYSAVDRYYHYSEERPNGKFIGPNQHDNLGAEYYPPLDTTDESIVSPVVPTA